MQDSDRKDFLQVFMPLVEVWDREMSSALIELYFRALEPWPLEQVKAAIVRSLRECRFFPKPAEIVEQIQAAGGRLEDVALTEAHKVLEAVARHGGGVSVCFDNPCTQAVIHAQFGGWVLLCDTLTEAERKWFLRDFTAAYQACARQGVELGGSLAGRYELHNAAHGHHEHMPPPVLIGDQDRARAVLLAGGSSLELLQELTAQLQAVKRTIELEPESEESEP